MNINIFADTICGWCFIGHTNLNNAIKKFPDTKFEISHTPFQLNPEMPVEGISRDKYLQIKFGGKDYATSMYENMKLKAQEPGVIFNLDKSEDSSWFDFGQLKMNHVILEDVTSQLYNQR